MSRLRRSLAATVLFPLTLAALLPAPAAHAREPRPLTLHEAHERALQNHPRITAADLRALAASQVVREARFGLFPSISANAVAVGTTSDNTRLAAVGALNNPTVFERNAEGLTISQLITDFGRTANLTRGSRLLAEAESDHALATREQILLAVDTVYYASLQAAAIARVAQQTLAARQTLLDQIRLMATNKLRSELDVGFARVNVEEGRLLSSKTENDLEESFGRLSILMGEREAEAFRLQEEPLPPEPATNVTVLVQQALRSRPDLLGARHEQEALLRLARAEQTWRRPTLSALGSLGVVPVHDAPLPDSYAAAGVVLNVPLFAGGLYSARQKETTLRAEAAEAALRDAENNAIRDVRAAWLQTRNALDRYRITGQLLEHARQTFSLAQSRYGNGMSSIVEFNQAELSLVAAEIARATTQYEYMIRRSTLDFETGTRP